MAKEENQDWCAHQSNVTKFFERHAGGYSDFFQGGTLTGASVLFLMRSAIATEMARGREGVFLDCATGTGEITRAAIECANFSEILINDISSTMLEKSKACLSSLPSFPNVTWMNQDVFGLNVNLKGRGIDTVFCLGLIAHTGRLGTLLRDMYSIMRPGGLLVLQSSLAEHWSTLISRPAVAWRYRRGISHRIFYYTFGDIKGEAEAAGFRISSCRRFGVCLPFGDRILGRWNHEIEKRWAAGRHGFGGEVVIGLQKK